MAPPPRTVPLATATLVAVLALTACGRSAAPEGSASHEPAPDVSTTRHDDAGPGSTEPGTFTFDAGDGELVVAGRVDQCVDPDESSLAVTFSGPADAVSVVVHHGHGAIAVAGADVFDGRVTDIEVGDAGDVVVRGVRSTTASTLTARTFELIGRCPTDW